MSDVAIDRIERLAESVGKLGDVMDKLPRLIELFGVSLFAGRASVRVGGDFGVGALGGAVADGLAHSELPNNQIAGIALGAYFAAIGLLNILPNGKPTIPPLIESGMGVDKSEGAGGTALSPDNIWSGLEPNEKVVPFNECGGPFGGTVVRPIPFTNLVVCNFPPVSELEQPAVSPGLARRGERDL